MSTKFDSTYSAVVSMAEQMVGEGKYDSTYSAVLAIYQNLTSDMDTKFDSVYSIVVKIADGIESGEIDLGGGGGEVIDPQKYNTHKFYNANGEIVEEWTLEETQSKTELPTIGGIPFGDWTLDFDGWNWDLEQLKSASCGQNIGAMYRPSDGKSHIVVEIEPENLTYVLFVNGNYTEVDWGDGVIEDADTINGYPQHTYTTAGSKEIKITGNWNPQWGVSPSYTQTWEGFPGWYYGSRIKAIFSGNKLGMLNFGYCTSLEFLTFTGDTHVYSSSWYNFGETKSLKYLAIPKGIIKYPTGRSVEVISMPFGVTSISSRGFEDWYCIKHINIPDSVTSIGMLAFYNCKSLQYLNIPDSVTSIGRSVFYVCHSLKSITIPDSVTSLGDEIFYNCHSLKSVTLGSRVTSIDDETFYNCKLLQSVNIPDGVTSIGGSSFYGCRSLKSITIPDSVTSIGNSAFSYCESLQSINIPDSVTSIGSDAFDYCYSLQSITIPDSVTSIGSFYECKSLQSINIPDSVTSIGNSAFSYCESLQSINIPDSVTSIGSGAFKYCYSLQSITIPDGVTSISNEMFYNCSSLPYIKIPNSVNSVGSSVFANVDYNTVDFSDCTQVPTLSSTNAFKSTALILVPESLYDEWIAATNWSSLSSQIKPVPGK